MASYLVTVVITDPDDDTARRLAASVAELVVEVVGLGDGDTETFVLDPTLVIR